MLQDDEADATPFGRCGVSMRIVASLTVPTPICETVRRLEAMEPAARVRVRPIVLDAPMRIRVPGSRRPGKGHAGRERDRRIDAATSDASRALSPRSSSAVRWAWLAAVLPLLPLLGIGFFNDDYEGLTRFARRGWLGVLEQFHPAHFEFLRPLGFLFFRIELSAFGTRGWPFHLVHIALFVAAALLAGSLAARMAGPRAGVWAPALALLYPGRVETVAWVAAIFDLLALALVTAALVLAVGGEWRGWRRPAALAGLAFIAPLAKESAYALPLVVLAWEALGVLADARLRDRLVRCAAVLAGAALAVGFRLSALGGVGGYAGTSLAALPRALTRLPEALVSVVLMPVNPTYGVASSIAAVLCATAFAAALVGAWRHRAACRLVLAGLALALIGLAPAALYLNPVTVAWDNSRLVALAGLGVALAAAGGLAPSGRWRTVAGTVLVAAWAGATLVNVQPWLAAGRARDAMLDTIEKATRGPGPQAVWVAGPILDYRGARFLGGRLQDAVDLAIPGRRIVVDSEFLQRDQGRPVGPPRVPAGTTLHLFRFDPELRQLVPMAVARGAQQSRRSPG
jgi:hypothetical protein